MSAGFDESAPSSAERACGDLLASGLEGEQPRAGWQQGVWARVERRRARRRWLWMGGLPLVAVAAMLALVLWPREASTPPLVASLTIDSERPAGAPRVRGDVAAGDTLVIAVRPLAAGATAQLRVYRADGTLVVACDRAAPCVRGEEGLTARVVGVERGKLRVLVVRGGGGELGSYDRDTASLLDAGGEILFSRTVEVY